MTSEERDEMRKKQVEMQVPPPPIKLVIERFTIGSFDAEGGMSGCVQYAQMSGQATASTQEETDAMLEKGLSKDVQLLLEERLQVRNNISCCYRYCYFIRYYHYYM